MRFTLFAAALAGLLVTACGGAGGSAAPASEKFPSQPIKLAIAGAAGDAFDTLGRKVAPTLSQKLGVDVRPVNVLGPQRADFYEAIHSAKPDGYTLGLESDSNDLQQVLFPGLLKYEVRTLPVVVPVRTVPDALFASPKSAFKSAADVLNAKVPVRIAKYGGITPGLASDIVTASERKVTLQPVTFPSFPEAHAALLRGDVDVLGGAASGTTLKFVRSNDYVPLWVWSDQRMSELPDTPTAKELGFDDGLIDSTLYRLWITAPTTPVARIDALAKGITAALQDPDIVAWSKQAEQPIDTVPVATWQKTFDARIQLYKPYLDALKPFAS